MTFITKKTPCLKPRTATINVGLMIMFILFLTSFASALEFDNVKTYYEETKVVTITNAFDFPIISSKIAEIQLKSEQEVQVGLGYQKVFEYEINSLKEYSNFIQDLEIYNLKKGFEKENKKVDLKYLAYENVEVNDYKEICNEIEKEKNGTIINNCSNELIGKHTETREVWKDLDSFDLKIGTKKISGWTNVEQGDYYEWVPNFAGVKVSEWATWSGSLLTELVAYYKLDEISGTTAYDSLNLHNLTNTNYTINKVGKIIKGYGMVGEKNTHKIMNTLIPTLIEGTLSFWVEQDLVRDELTLYFSNGTKGNLNWRIGTSQRKPYVQVYQNAGTQPSIIGTTNISSNEFYHYVINWSANSVSLYINNILIGSNSSSTNITLNNLLFGTLGGDDWTWLYSLNGTLDEVGIWNRSISPTEISILYNSGNGCAFGNETCFAPPDNPPTITLNEPIDTYNSTSQDITFNCTGSDDIYLVNVSLIINGTYNGTNSTPYNNTPTIFSRTLADGFYNWTCGACDNATTPQCVNGTARTFSMDTTPPQFTDTTLNVSTIYNVGDPIRLNTTITDTNLDTCWYNYNNANTTFVCTSGVLNEEDITTIASQTDIRVWANDSLGNTNYSELLTFAYDTTPPTITLNYPTSLIDYGAVNGTLQLNFTATDTNLDYCGFGYYTITSNKIQGYGNIYQNHTNFSLIAQLHRVVSGGNPQLRYTITIPANCKNNGKITLYDDDTNVSCIDTGGANVTLTPSVGGHGLLTKFFEVTPCSSGVPIVKNITLSQNKVAEFYANDTAGNLNTTTFSWDYRVFENNRTFSNETLSGSIEDFSINVTLGNETEIVSAIFVYNGTNTSSVITSIGNFRLITIDDFEIPIFSSSENISFYWEILLSDGTNFSTYTSTHLVSVLKLDNCSTYTFQLANISLFDEETLQLIRGDIEVYYSILNKPKYNSIKNLSGIFENISNTLICSDINLSNQNLAYSTEIRYSSEKGLFDDVGYAKEFYHIQRSDIGELIKISLYDLHLNETTEFEIEYQNEDLVKVANAIVQLQRKYIAEDIYRVVEAPITSNEGTAVLHIDLNTNKYKITIIKDGVVLDIFDNIVFVCDNVLSGQCEQKLYGSIDPTNDIPLETIQDFSYTLSEVNNTITIDFSIPSGVPSNINFLMYQSDQFGTTTLCNRTIISSAGSTSCIYNNTITDSYLDLILTRDGNVISSRTYIVQEADGVDFLDNNFFIVFIFLISIVGMAFTSPEWIIMNSVIVFVISGALWLLNGMNFVMGLGGLAWLILGAGILIFKLTKQEDR